MQKALFAKEHNYTNKSYLGSLLAAQIAKYNNDNIIINSKNVKIYQNIRFAGEDIKPNKVLIKKFHIINSSSMGLLASQGISKVKVFKNLIKF